MTAVKNNNMDIPIVIPSYQPNELLINLCTEFKSLNLNNVIIIDDGSQEEYQDIFKKVQDNFNYKVLRHDKNKGKGRALKTAFNYIINNTNSIGCVTADSDGQHIPKDIIKCIEALRKNPDSLILGYRDFSLPNVPNKSRLGNTITRKIFSYLCGIKIKDTQTGLRGIPTKFMKELLNVDGERFEFETNMLIECKNHINIVEIPIQTIYDSKKDHKTHFNPVKDSIKIYRLFAKKFFKYILSVLSSFILDIALFSLFCILLKNKVSTSYLFIATILARTCSAIYNYFINYYFVFHNKYRKKEIKRTIGKYFLLVIIQMLLCGILVTGVNLIFNNLNVNLIKVLIDILLFFINYYIQLKFIF